MSRVLRFGLSTLGASLLLAGPAQAAQRYVSPAGAAAAPCTQAAPCSLEAGFNNAVANDEVIVTPGTYTTSTDLANSASQLTIHGQDGQPRPVINTSAMTGLSMNGSSPTARDLTINHTGTNYALVLFSSNARADRLSVRSTSTACSVVGLLRDSLCASTGTGDGFDLSASGGTSNIKLRNVTAVGGSPNGFGMSFTAGAATTVTVDARNVIAFGRGAFTDVRVTTNAVTSSTTATLQSSNFDTVQAIGPGNESVTPPGTGTNQTALPLFADTVDYREAPGSPTIDAGTTDPDTGTTTDLDGQPRVQGAAIDIGADEFAPLATPPPAADTTPPQTTIAKGPKRKTRSRRAKFVFSSSEPGSTFECKLDKKAFKPCTSPAKYKRLKRGKHRFSVRATDAAGNADATPATYRWRVKKR